MCAFPSFHRITIWIWDEVQQGMIRINRCDLKISEILSWTDMKWCICCLWLCGLTPAAFGDGENGTTNITVVSCRFERPLAARRGPCDCATDPLMVYRIPTVTAGRICTVLLSDSDSRRPVTLQSYWAWAEILRELRTAIKQLSQHRHTFNSSARQTGAGVHHERGAGSKNQNIILAADALLVTWPSSCFTLLCSSLFLNVDI